MARGCQWRHEDGTESDGLRSAAGLASGEQHCRATRPRCCHRHVLPSPPQSSGRVARNASPSAAAVAAAPQLSRRHGQGFSTLHLQHVPVGAARPSASALGGARLFDMMVVPPHERGLCGMLLCGCSSEENGGRRSWKLISLWCEDAFLVFSTFHASRQAPLHPWSSTSQTNE